MTTELSYLSSCKKYASELSDSIEGKRKFKDKPPLLMLSGGVDSLLLGSVLRKRYESFESITIAGKNTEDIQTARHSCYQLGIDNTIIKISLDELMDNLHLAKGKNIKTVFSLQFYLTLLLAFRKYPITETDVIQGSGGDALLGSVTSFIYITATDVAKEKQISKNDARTFLKQKYFRDSIRLKRGAAHLFTDAVNESGGNPIQPYKNKKVYWVNDLPYEFARPDKKLFHRKTIASLGINPKKAKRLSMQQGSGLYEELQKALTKKTGAKSANAAVKIILNEQ